jgi:hypothetical protein
MDVVPRGEVLSSVQGQEINDGGSILFRANFNVPAGSPARMALYLYQNSDWYQSSARVIPCREGEPWRAGVPDASAVLLVQVRRVRAPRP